MAKIFFKCYKKIYLFALTSTHSTKHFFNVILSRFLMTLFWQYSSIQFMLKMKIFSGHWIPATPRVILSLLRTKLLPTAQHCTWVRRYCRTRSILWCLRLISVVSGERNRAVRCIYLGEQHIALSIRGTLNYSRGMAEKMYNSQNK